MRDKLLLAAVFFIGCTFGSLVTYLSRNPDQVALDAAQAGEECCAALRSCQAELDR
jgi:hypothetical protein